MEDVLSEAEARAAVADPGMKPAQQLLRLPPNPGGDPEDSLSDIAYEKGRWFLSFLEHRQKHGRENGDDGDNDQEFDQRKTPVKF